MGYTHYITRPKEIEPTDFSRIADDIAKLIDHSPVPLADIDGAGRPEVNDATIGFNGLGDDGYESFYFPRITDRTYEFCKTDRRPYDVMVVAALVVIKHHLPGCVGISSDGDDSDWEAGRALVQTHLGYGAEMRLDDKRNLTLTS